MEYMDILDEQGKPTGEVKSREAIHRDGDWHGSVHGWLLNSKHELLFQKRSPTKQANPNKWSVSFAGHISAGNTSIDSLIQKAHEELGLNLKKETVEYLCTAKKQAVLNNGHYIDNGFNEVYLVRVDLDPSTLKLQSEEVSEVAYMYYKDAQKLITQGDPAFVDHPEEYASLFAYIESHPSITAS